MTFSGITTDEATALLKQHGANEIAVETNSKAGSIFIAQFANFLVVLLVIAATISFLLGHLVDGIFIVAIVLLNSVLGFIQEYRAERALAALKKIAIVRSTVIRDGQETEIDSKFLVPGDVIKVGEGDKIPADAKLLESVNLEVNEASLTGESLPVFKKESEAEHEQIFMGTIVVRGRGIAKVENTAIRTRFGTIAKGLSEITDEQTPLQKQLVEIGKRLGFTAIGGSIVVLLIGILRGQDFLILFLTSVSLAVAAVPEGLPAVITITLAVGVNRMVRQRAIVRKMASIETLGAATIIATDKTGTITQNNMRVRRIYTDGQQTEVKDHKSTDREDILEVLRIGCIANTASLVFKHDDGSADIIGDPTEGALLIAAHELYQQPTTLKEKGTLIDEFSFDATRKTMSVIWKEADGRIFVYAKGSPERMLQQSISTLEKGKEVVLTPQKIHEIQQAFEQSASLGFRIIAMGKKSWRHHNKGEVARDEIESNLIFVGFVAIADPPRPEVKEAAKLAASAGVKTIMITGDNELTANAIAQEVGLISEGEDVLTGQQLDELTEEELRKVLPNVRIFARTTPAHKLRIVKAYQALGHVVAVTGDGINDALALRQANVGVAMGATGTDVAKEAADIIVTDDNYASVVRAIEEGRIIYDNIVKSVTYLASGNLGEMLTLLLAVIIGLPNPLLPVQILWINLVTDGLPALALAVDSKDPLVMKRQPRGFGQIILSTNNLRFIFSIGIIISLATLASFWFTLSLAGELAGRTVAFTTIIAFHVGLVFFIRKNGNIFSNRFLLFSMLLVMCLQTLILFVPALQTIFRVGPLW